MSAYKASLYFMNIYDRTFIKPLINEYRIPELFNTDQGSQYTDDSWIEELKEHDDITIIMDERGRGLGNRFVERLRSSLKHKEIYLKNYAAA